MKKSPQYLRSTLRHAHALQARYDALGASRHQRIRNPMPMRQLVVGVLPTLPDPDAVVKVTVTRDFNFNGRSFSRKATEFLYASEVVPASSWAKRGLSVRGVMASLEKKGYLVRSQSTVACMLSQAKNRGEVAAVSTPSPSGRGRPRSIYFATE